MPAGASPTTSQPSTGPPSVTSTTSNLNAMNAQCLSSLRKTHSRADNSRCADCDDPGTTHFAYEYGVFICAKCSSVHHSKQTARIVCVDTSSAELQADCEAKALTLRDVSHSAHNNGNLSTRHDYEFHCQPKPDSAMRCDRATFIENKYRNRKWHVHQPLKGDGKHALCLYRVQIVESYRPYSRDLEVESGWIVKVFRADNKFYYFNYEQMDRRVKFKRTKIIPYHDGVESIATMNVPTNFTRHISSDVVVPHFTMSLDTVPSGVPTLKYSYPSDSHSTHNAPPINGAILFSQIKSLTLGATIAALPSDCAHLCLEIATAAERFLLEAPNEPIALQWRTGMRYLCARHDLLKQHQNPAPAQTDTKNDPNPNANTQTQTQNADASAEWSRLISGTQFLRYDIDYTQNLLSAPERITLCLSPHTSPRNPVDFGVLFWVKTGEQRVWTSANSLHLHQITHVQEGVYRLHPQLAQQLPHDRFFAIYVGATKGELNLVSDTPQARDDWLSFFEQYIHKCGFKVQEAANANASTQPTVPTPIQPFQPTPTPTTKPVSTVLVPRPPPARKPSLLSDDDKDDYSAPLFHESSHDAIVNGEAFIRVKRNRKGVSEAQKCFVWANNDGVFVTTDKSATASDRTALELLANDAAVTTRVPFAQITDISMGDYLFPTVPSGGENSLAFSILSNREDVHLLAPETSLLDNASSSWLKSLRKAISSLPTSMADAWTETDIGTNVSGPVTRYTYRLPDVNTALGARGKEFAYVFKRATDLHAQTIRCRMWFAPPTIYIAFDPTMFARVPKLTNNELATVGQVSIHEVTAIHIGDEWFPSQSQQQHDDRAFSIFTDRQRLHFIAPSANVRDKWTNTLFSTLIKQRYNNVITSIKDAENPPPPLVAQQASVDAPLVPTSKQESDQPRSLVHDRTRPLLSTVSDDSDKSAIVTTQKSKSGFVAASTRAGNDDSKSFQLTFVSPLNALTMGAAYAQVYSVTAQDDTNSTTSYVHTVQVWLDVDEDAIIFSSLPAAIDHKEMNAHTAHRLRTLAKKSAGLTSIPIADITSITQGDHNFPTAAKPSHNAHAISIATAATEYHLVAPNKKTRHLLLTSLHSIIIGNSNTPFLGRIFGHGREGSIKQTTPRVARGKTRQHSSSQQIFYKPPTEHIAFHARGVEIYTHSTSATADDDNKNCYFHRVHVWLSLSGGLQHHHQPLRVSPSDCIFISSDPALLHDTPSSAAFTKLRSSKRTRRIQICDITDVVAGDHFFPTCSTPHHNARAFSIITSAQSAPLHLVMNKKRERNEWIKLVQTLMQHALTRSVQTFSTRRHEKSIIKVTAAMESADAIPARDPESIRYHFDPPQSLSAPRSSVLLVGKFMHIYSQNGDNGLQHYSQRCTVWIVKTYRADDGETELSADDALCLSHDPALYEADKAAALELLSSATIGVSIRLLDVDQIVRGDHAFPTVPRPKRRHDRTAFSIRTHHGYWIHLAIFVTECAAQYRAIYADRPNCEALVMERSKFLYAQRDVWVHTIAQLLTDNGNFSMTRTATLCDHKGHVSQYTRSQETNAQPKFKSRTHKFAPRR